MSLKRLIVGMAMFISVSFVLSGSAAAAWNPFGDGTGCGSGEGGSSSAACQDSATQSGKNGEDPLTGPDGLIMDITNVVAFVAGAAAVIIIVLAGLRMVTSSGSSEDIAGARRALIYAVVGLIVISLARIIVGFVISAL